ncbi:MAG: hypothetical protein ACXWJ6_03525 [Xanthobacteraceae bacterium]
MRCVGLSLLCLALGACSIALDDNSGVFASAPGKYDYLDCRGLSLRAKSAATREAELNDLMERAKRDAFGPVVNTLVYRDELNTVRADRLALQKTSDEKRCLPDLAPQNTSLEPVH